jgi:hypothetical protein
MSDPNSKSSDILSDGPVKYILRPEVALHPDVRYFNIPLCRLTPDDFTHQVESAGDIPMNFNV